jgi:hypothetical protein
MMVTCGRDVVIGALPQKAYGMATTKAGQVCIRRVCICALELAYEGDVDDVDDVVDF